MVPRTLILLFAEAADVTQADLFVGHLSSRQYFLLLRHFGLFGTIRLRLESFDDL